MGITAFIVKGINSHSFKEALAQLFSDWNVCKKIVVIITRNASKKVSKNALVVFEYFFTDLKLGTEGYHNGH